MENPIQQFYKGPYSPQYYKKLLSNKKYRKANRERERQRRRKYYAVNKEKIAAYNKQYREANKERLAEYKEVNKDKIAVQRKKYYQDNKERINEYQNFYRKLNPDKVRQWNKNYRLKHLAKLEPTEKKHWYDGFLEERKKT